MVMKKHKK